MAKDIVSKTWSYLPKISGRRYSAIQSSGANTDIFPLSVSSNGRFLQSPNGNPFWIHGDSPWSIDVQLTRAQVDTYINDTAAKGYTAIIFEAFEHKFSDQTPAYQNREGNNPFTSMTDFSTPNTNYWGMIDYIVNAAKAKNIVCLIAFAYLGFQAGDEGWMAEVTAESNGDLQSYGAFLNNRYNQGNIIWVAGGDFAGDSTQRAKQYQIVTGMRSVRTTDLITGHAARGEAAYSFWNGNAGWNLNNIYTDGTEYTYAATEYARSPALPFFQIEGYYFGDAATLAECRRQVWVTNLSGSCGAMTGSQPIWDFGSAAFSGVGVTAALATLNSTTRQQMAHVPTIFNTYAQNKLVPKTDTSFVSSSLGSGTTRVVAALSNDNTYGMVWINSAVSPIVVMTNFVQSSVRGRWYDPTNGTYTNVSGTPFVNTGSKTFTNIGNNAAGDPDWVLVLD